MSDSRSPSPSPDDPAAAEAAAAALRRATRSTQPARKGTTRRGRPGTFSDARDPQPVGVAVERLIEDQGWQRESTVAVLMADWSQVVGPGLADHLQPLSFADGELVCQAESTAWATQVRLLLPQLHRMIDDRVGRGVVSRIRIQGPPAPNWGAGQRRVPGRGPRDTYG